MMVIEAMSGARRGWIDFGASDSATCRVVIAHNN